MHAYLSRRISVTISITIAFFARNKMQQRCPQWSSAQGQESTNLYAVILITNFDKTPVGTLGDKLIQSTSFSLSQLDFDRDQSLVSTSDARNKFLETHVP